MEQFEDADAAYYQYRRLSQANKNWSFSKLGDIFMCFSCGYGVRPFHTIGLGVALILLFSLIYWRGNGIRRLKEIDGDDSRVSFWDALYFSQCDDKALNPRDASTIHNTLYFWRKFIMNDLASVEEAIEKGVERSSDVVH